VTAGKQGAASVTPTTLPDGWSVEQFGNLVENYDSVRVPVRQGDRRPGSYPYYGASGIVDHVDGYLFHGEYLLIAEDGENLRTRQTPIAFLATGKFWVNNHAHIVRANSRASTRFLAYVLAHADVSGYLTGSTMPKLTQANMNRIPLAAPPVDEQRAIAGVLGALDGKIELNRRTNETLEAIARALFKSWFVDSANGLKTAKFSTIAMLSRGAINPSDSPQEIFEHYSIPAYDERRMPVAEFGTAIKSNKFVVPLDCVLLSKLNPRIPRVWMPDVARERRAVSSTEFLVLRPTHVSREYLYGLCSSDTFLSEFATMVTGTSGSHQRVKGEFLSRMDVLLPDAIKLQQYTGIVAPMHQRIALNLRENETLASLRDALLPRLLSGELRVREAEKMMEAALHG